MPWKIKTQLRITATILSLIFLNSCIKEDVEFPQVPVPENYDVTFVMQLPGNPAPGTRALESTHENKVVQIAVMVFSEDGEYLYTSFAQSIDDDVNNDRRKTFTVKLVPGTDVSDRFKLVILANANQYIATGIRGDYEEIMDGLLAQIPTDGWDVDPQSSNYKHIPMWGVKEDVIIEKGTTLVNEAIPMLRMLAKVDVILQPAASAVFTLKSVRLYNYRKEGRVAPSQTAWSDTEKKVKVPSLPAGNHTKGPLIYEVPENTTAFENNIYMAETRKGTAGDFPDHVCLVIGGLYDGGQNETYYRVDFGNVENGQTNYLDILRNHRYIVNIGGIGGPGFPDPEQAYNAVPVNIVGELIEWDDGSMEAFIIGEDCFLAIMPGKFNFDMVSHGDDSEFNNLSIFTNWSTGWEITDITYEDPADAGWITIREEDKTGAAEEEKSIKVYIAANDAVNAKDRKGYIHIQASRLSYKLPVYQSTLADLWLEIVDDNGDEIHELIFYGYPDRPHLVTDQNFTLKWSPAFETVNTTSLIVGSELFNMAGFSPGLASGTVSDTDGVVEFTVNPGAFTIDEVDRQWGNPFLQKGARVEFSVTYNGHTARKSLYVRQINYDIIVDGVSQLSFLGHSYDFRVRSNSEWRIKEVRNSSAIMSSSDLFVGKTGGNNTNLGEKLNYRMVTATYNANPLLQGLGQAGRWFDIVFEDINGVFPDETVRIIAVTPDANTIQVAYVSGGHFSFPVRKMFWMWESDWLDDPSLAFDYENFNSADLDVRIIWQSEQGMLRTNQQGNNIFFSDLGGKGDPRDFILNMHMKTGSSMSNNNALVAVRYKGQILWSWQIWISNYNGQTYTWQGKTYMDRNLGGGTLYGTGGRPSFNVTWSGMYYQWGRKDPFISSYGADGDKNQGSSPIYPHEYNGAMNKNLIRHAPVSVVNNLVNSVRNPDTFYTSSQSSPTKDWYTASTDSRHMNDYMWNDEKTYKGMFDPCPYGWRVPAYPHGITVTNPFYAAQGQYISGWWFSSVGYFPNTGVKDMETGNFTLYNYYSNYWMANAIGYNVGAAAWQGGPSAEYAHDVVSKARSTGGPVRCVRDNNGPL